VPTRFLDFKGWWEQKDGYLATSDIYAVIADTVSISSALSELVKQNLFNLWYDETGGKIRIRSFIPADVNEPVKPLTDISNLVLDRTSAKDYHDARATQIWIFYGALNWTKYKDDKDFRRAYVAANTDLENDNAFGEKRVIKIYSRWWSDPQNAQAISLGTRYLQKFSDTPVRVKFDMDVKDSDVGLADNFVLQSDVYQDEFGAPLNKKMIIISKQEDPYKGTVTYEAEAVGYEAIYGFVAPDATPEYTSASAAEKLAYGFISQDNGLMTNGDDGYSIQ